MAPNVTYVRYTFFFVQWQEVAARCIYTYKLQSELDQGANVFSSILCAVCVSICWTGFLTRCSKTVIKLLRRHTLSPREKKKIGGTEGH